MEHLSFRIDLYCIDLAMAEMDPRSDVAEHLDTRGRVCPLPILMTAKAMKHLEVGQVLEVLGDDPAILDDMPVYCFRAGHRLLAMEEDDEDGTIRCRLEKVKQG